MRLAVALDVVLASREVPHEVAPVHVVELIIDEIAQIHIKARLPRGSLLHGVAHGIDCRSHSALVVQIRRHLVKRRISRFGPALAHRRGDVCKVRGGILRPALISAHMACPVVGAVDAREKHLHVRHVTVGWLVAFLHIFVGLQGRRFRHLRPQRFRIVVGAAVLVAQIAVEHLGYGASVGIHTHKAVAVSVVHDVKFLGKGHAIEQRALAVLLAVHIGREGKHIVRGILVHRRIGRRTYQQQGIARIAHENHEHTEHNHVKHTHGQFRAEHEQPSGKRHYNDGGQPPRADERQTAESQPQQAAPADGCGTFLMI